jgi:hypothetical protein
MRLNKTCHVSFCQNSPLKIRGVRGVMVMEMGEI